MPPHPSSSLHSVHAPAAPAAAAHGDVHHQLAGRAQLQQMTCLGGDDYWGMEPNHSYVSSCAVDSAQQHSFPMDWCTGHMPSAAAAADAPPAPAAVAMVPTALTNHRSAAVPASAEDPLRSAVAAAAAAANPWAWLSDVATGARSAAAPSDQSAAIALHNCHTTSRRLFTTEAANPTMSMQWRLQQQADQLQTQLAAATQQLQLHSVAFNTAAPAVTLASG